MGSAERLNATYNISALRGTHGISHTRMATESRVDISHAHPFWARPFPDITVVHNGHITNYHKLRRHFEMKGHRFNTENDSEVIAIYIADILEQGGTLDDAVRSIRRHGARNVRGIGERQNGGDVGAGGG